MLPGTKYDNGKLRWDLLKFGPVEDVVKVLTMGAKKYADNNWQLVEDGQDRYFAALMRHLTTWRKGELIDPESGLPHLAHVACNVMFLQWFDQRREEAGDMAMKLYQAITTGESSTPLPVIGTQVIVGDEQTGE